MVRRQQVRQETQQRQLVANDVGVTFSQGVMHVGGAPQIPEAVQKWESSNGLTQYTTVRWRDPGTGDLRCSCNCPGWAHRKKNADHRECCHTLDMTGEKSCNKTKVSGEQPVATVHAAEELIPKLQGRPLRQLMLD